MHCPRVLVSFLTSMLLPPMLFAQEQLPGTELLNLPPGRLLFGSHAPLFYFESAALKLQESPLTDAQLRAVRFESAERLLPDSA